MPETPYVPPEIVVVGTLADLTRQFGFGAGSDSQFPIIAQYAPKLNGWITYS